MNRLDRLSLEQYISFSNDPVCFIPDDCILEISTYFHFSSKVEFLNLSLVSQQFFHCFNRYGVFKRVLELGHTFSRKSECQKNKIYTSTLQHVCFHGDLGTIPYPQLRGYQGHNLFLGIDCSHRKLSIEEFAGLNMSFKIDIKNDEGRNVRSYTMKNYGYKSQVKHDGIDCSEARVSRLLRLSTGYFVKPEEEDGEKTMRLKMKIEVEITTFGLDDSCFDHYFKIQ